MLKRKRELASVPKWRQHHQDAASSAEGEEEEEDDDDDDDDDDNETRAFIDDDDSNDTKQSDIVLRPVFCEESDEEEEEVTADAALARWWRGQQRESFARGEVSKSAVSLNKLDKTADGRRFLSGEASGLRHELSTGSQAPSTHASLASFLWRLGDLHGAKKHFGTALTRAVTSGKYGRAIGRPQSLQH